jgi:tetratricopeptide (TPR) repeat protein
MKTSTIKKYGRVFIIRPFNLKENKKGEKIDFELIDKELITPVINQLGLSGGTTGEFVQQGNIRVDMFRELLSADLVVADISIHNANAFYELGLRHALRDRYTVMIKASKNSDPHIFDLNSDRYMPYDPGDPAASIETLIKVVEETLANEQVDSPIFQLLPGLESMDPNKVVVVPLKFREQVELKNKDVNGLATLLNEAIGEHWETEGLRLIGTAQFNLGEHKKACATWERIRKFDMYDAEANQKLATSYQKLGEHTLSDHAAKRALENHPSDWDRAETHALIASNYKTRWRNQWEAEDKLEQRQQDALISPLLKQAYDAYHLGFEQHRSHYYSGLNAVAMLCIQLQLAKLHPEIWALDFDDEQDAEFELQKMTKHCAKLTAATELAIDSSIRNYPDDAWALLSLADLLLLTSDQPKKVKQKYKKCTVVVKGFTASSVLNQVKLYQTLGLLEENVNAAIEIIGEHHD